MTTQSRSLWRLLPLLHLSQSQPRSRPLRRQLLRKRRMMMTKTNRLKKSLRKNLRMSPSLPLLQPLNQRLHQFQLPPPHQYPPQRRLPRLRRLPRQTIESLPLGPRAFTGLRQPRRVVFEDLVAPFVVVDRRRQLRAVDARLRTQLTEREVRGTRSQTYRRFGLGLDRLPVLEVHGLPLRLAGLAFLQAASRGRDRWVMVPPKIVV